jgi:hypothetical protein
MKIYKNVHIYTLQSEGHIEEAAVVDQGRFVFVGNETTAREQYPSAEIIDCKDMVMLPGFNDSHMHLLGYSMTLSQLDLSQTTSIAKIQSEIITFSQSHDFIFGRGWNQDYLIDKHMPTRQDLDKTGLDKPIILIRACGHILCCNSAAMKQAGVYHEDGLFREHEMDQIKAILPRYTLESLKKHLEDAEKMLLSYGVTSVQTDDLSAVTESDHDLVLCAMQEMNHLIRVYEQTNYNSYGNFIRHIPDYIQDKHSSSMFRMGPIKLLGDGSLGAHTAKLQNPYSDCPEMPGLLNFTESELTHIASLCEKHGLDMAIHAIGDQMVKYALDMTRGSKLRHSIVHCQITSPAILETIIKENILLHIQPIFLHYDMHIAEERLGPERVKYAYNYRTLTDSGIPIAFGTDCPVEPPNPFFGIYSAVTRKDRTGYPKTGWYPDEALSLDQALVHYTSGSAYGSYDEDHLGKIKEGYTADFILLEKDPFTLQPEEWLKLKVKKSFVGGELRYENNY